MSVERKMNGKKCTNTCDSGHVDYEEVGGTILNKDKFITSAALV
jgi:hypothetical protein